MNDLELEALEKLEAAYKNPNLLGQGLLNQWIELNKRLGGFIDAVKDSE